MTYGNSKRESMKRYYERNREKILKKMKAKYKKKPSIKTPKD